MGRKFLSFSIHAILANLIPSMSSGAESSEHDQTASETHEDESAGDDRADDGISEDDSPSNSAESAIDKLDKEHGMSSDDHQAPIATIGLDLNDDGIADTYVSGVDLDKDGIPDMLQKGSMATVGIDINHDGRADTIVTGSDLNCDGIPDFLQQGGKSSFQATLVGVDRISPDLAVLDVDSLDTEDPLQRAIQDEDAVWSFQNGRTVLPDLPDLKPKRKAGADVFAFWDRGGRRVMPVSHWTIKKKDLTRASEAVGGVFAEAHTLRSSLVGPTWPPPSPLLSTGRSCSQASSRSEPPENSAFDGLWIGRADGEMRGRIEGSRLTWYVDKSISQLRIIRHQSRGGVGDVISFTLDGETHAGTLSPDGSVLRWRDGDRWLRVDEGFERMQAYTGRALSPTGRRRQSFKDVDRNSCWSRSLPLSLRATPRPSSQQYSSAWNSSQQFSTFWNTGDRMTPRSSSRPTSQQFSSSWNASDWHVPEQFRSLAAMA